MGMTIAIKDFELPPSCYNCNFCMRRRTSDYGYFGMCDLTNEEGINLYEHSRSEDCPLVEAIPKADYENRLKADMVAMLTEIQMELDEMKITKVRSAGFAPYSKDPFRRGVNCSKEVIQQKINALKGAEQ